MSEYEKQMILFYRWMDEQKIEFQGAHWSIDSLLEVVVFDHGATVDIYHLANGVWETYAESLPIHSGYTREKIREAIEWAWKGGARE